MNLQIWKEKKCECKPRNKIMLKFEESMNGINIIAIGERGSEWYLLKICQEGVRFYSAIPKELQFELTADRRLCVLP